MASIPSKPIAVGGALQPNKRGYYFYYYYLFYYLFVFYANPLPSSISPPLNPHNRRVDDCVAGEEEVLIEGVEMKVEAEEMAEDVGVGQKIMRNRAHVEALLIFYSVRKWREIRRAGRRWRRLQ